jgi:class 3 adenylate cyclase
MHPWPYQIVRRRPACNRAARVRRDPCFGMARTIFLIMMAQTLGMVMATPLRPARRSAIVPGTDGGAAPRNGRRPRPAQTLPVHRSILAVDIEGSTQRKNPVKEELREQVYRLLLEALCAAGINEAHCDPFTDRGDGVLVLLHPADELPKPLLLTRLIPALVSLLEAHNNGISPAEQTRILRLRAVLHAGEVHHDGNGPFGEDLDIAFRLLDAPRFKAHLRSATLPLALVASEYIYRAIIRHGYCGIDEGEFLQIVSVNVGDQRQKGWVHAPRANGFPVAVPAQVRAEARAS